MACWVEDLDGQIFRDLSGIDALARFIPNDLAVLDDEYPISDVQREAQNLLGDNDRQATLIANALQRARHLADDRGLNALGRLVEQQHLRLGGQSPGQ